MNMTSSSIPVHILSTSPRGAVELAVFSDVGGWMHQNVSERGEDTTSGPNETSAQAAEEFDPLGGHTIWQVVIIVFLTGSLSLVTVVGNILVMVSFKINKALKTVNNYYLLSLAFADLTIGILSMNLYTTYIIMDQWALGPLVCDLRLAVDYVASNASVMNLLVISFDRYFSVTRPLTYMAKRTTKRALTMIGLAWSISFLLWAPAILFWQYIMGERTVQPTECYIQFLTEPIITFCTAIAAFYLPVTIMSVLFWRIYQETEKRAKDVQSLRGSGCGTSPSQNPGSARGNAEAAIKKTSMLRQMSSQSCSSIELNQAKVSESGVEGSGKCAALVHCCLSPLPCRWSSASVNISTTEGQMEQESIDSVNNNGVSVNRPLTEKDPFTTPTDGNKSAKEKNQDNQSSSSVKSEQRAQTSVSPSLAPDLTPATSISIKDAAMAKRFASKAKADINKRKNEKKANEKKAARTLSAILLAFVTTWLPYNIMVLVNTFCQECIPETLWALGYWLCYVNSTINPMCYALCNKTFRTTFRDILMCQWNQRKKKAHKKAVAFRRKGPL